MNHLSQLAIGVDIGGTFTDFVIYDARCARIETFKLISTPHNPAEAVLQGIKQILGEFHGESSLEFALVHGSTVATNALLERKGARTALVTTHGFADVIQIGRQNRPELYNLLGDLPQPLVPPDLRFELDERVDSCGEILKPLDPSQLAELLSKIQPLQVESIAVCLLFSFLNPDHERIVAEQLRSAGYPVSASVEILPEFREYERTSTTAVNAYVSPILDRYLSSLEKNIANGSHLRVMQSNGGVIQVDVARRFGVNCILSGPAGGVIASHFISRLARQETSAAGGKNHLKIITFDMGGTSTDVSLIDGSPQLTNESVISGCPIRIPMLDIHTIGAGGGSIAKVDAGGALRVGPESAGADPGPACYGKGVLPTVTDANLLLGRLAAEYFLDGQLPLDIDRARTAIEQISQKTKLSPSQTALGIIQVANAHMVRALRLISVERGHDPRDFSLLSFGGAGGLHAAELARSIGIQQVLVPPMASTLSAFGMLTADIVKDYSQTVMLPGETPLSEVEDRLQLLVERGVQEVLAEGVPAQRIASERRVDLRYKGQSYELVVLFTPQLLEDFHTLHNKLYGYSRTTAPIEIVNLRVRTIGGVVPPSLPAREISAPDPALAFIEKRQVCLNSGVREVSFYRGEKLLPGNLLAGPALIVRADTTILLDIWDQARVDQYSNLLISIGQP